MPPQSRAAQGFAGVAVEIDLIHKGIKTSKSTSSMRKMPPCRVEIDLIHKGIKTVVPSAPARLHGTGVEIDLIHKGIKTRFHGCRFQFPLAQKWK